jgi:hypothetical protein
MASVDKPRYGVKVKYTNGVETTMWRRTEVERDRLHRQLNADKKVKTAKRVNR